MPIRFATLPLFLLLLTGCTTQDLARLHAARDQTVSLLASARQSETDIKTQIAALPPNDPVRKSLEPKIAQLDQIVAQGQKYLPVVDGAIASAQTGQLDPTLSAAVSVIPYGSLVLAFVSLAWGVVKHVQAANTLTQHAQTQQAFEQVVSALNAALPNPTPAQQSAIAAQLDPQVQTKVATARAT